MAHQNGLPTNVRYGRFDFLIRVCLGINFKLLFLSFQEFDFINV